MYAIIESGGKQYRVEQGDIIHVELLKSAANNKVEFKNVLFVHDGNKAKIGAPYVSKSSVVGELLDETRGPKVIAFKYKRRKQYRRKVGHRQNYSQVKITEIVG